MTAINKVVENNGDFIGAFRENVIRVIGGYSTKDIPTEYDEQIESLQKEILTLIEENAKQGAVAEDFDEDLVRRLINTIKVNKGERLEIQFESGIVMEHTIDHYE